MSGELVKRKIRIRVDEDLCFGFGDCVDSAPGVLELSDDDIAVVVDPYAQDLDTVLIAAGDCPVDAIFVFDEESDEQLYP